MLVYLFNLLDVVALTYKQQEAIGSVMKHQEVPKSFSRCQEAPGSIKKHQEGTTSK